MQTGMYVNQCVLLEWIELVIMCLFPGLGILTEMCNALGTSSRNGLGMKVKCFLG